MTRVELKVRRVSELSAHQALSRVRRLNDEDRLAFLEYAAASNPDETNALLDQFEENSRTRPLCSNLTINDSVIHEKEVTRHDQGRAQGKTSVRVVRASGLEQGQEAE